MNLTVLLKRSDLLQIAVFLKAEGRPKDSGTRSNSEKVFLDLLAGSMSAVPGAICVRKGSPDVLGAENLASLDLARTPLPEELTVEAAVWIRRLYESKAESNLRR